jgi:GT2 family glycosyltransferase
MQNQPPKVEIIILNWNGLLNTIECINSLKKSDYPNFQITVVDNGSKDNSYKHIRSNYPDVNIIKNDYNQGFADGNNIGIKYAIAQGADYVLLLNNDTVVANNTLSAMIDIARTTENLGVLGGRILFYSHPTIIQSCGVQFLHNDINMGRILYEGYSDEQTTLEKAMVVDHLIGCAILISVKTIQTIGMFDSRFFAYWEDTDLCVRATEHNLVNICATDARIWHKISASTDGGSHPSRYYYMSRNRVLFLKKHPYFTKNLVLKIFINDSIALLSSRYSLKFTALAATIHGLFDAYTNKFGNLPKWLSSAKSDFLETKIRLKITSTKRIIKSLQSNT